MTGPPARPTVIRPPIGSAGSIEVTDLAPHTFSGADVPQCHAPLQCAAGDDHAMDLRRAVEDPVDARIAVQPLDGLLSRASEEFWGGPDAALWPCTQPDLGRPPNAGPKICTTRL